jgi:radical SAM protein with 4Fe4S-binding SPASM domain
LALKCPATRENAHEISGIAQLAKDLGVEFRYDPLILATMEGEQHPRALRLSADEIVALEASDVEKDRAWRKYLTEKEHPTVAGDRLFSCGAGQNFLHVDPYGNVQVCLMVKNFERNLREKPLERIYYDDFPEILSTKRGEASKCGDCARRSTCDNCPGMALWETRSSHSQVDFACHLSDARAKTFGAAAGETRAEAVALAGGCGSGGRARSGGCGGDERSTFLQIAGLS